MPEAFCGLEMCAKKLRELCVLCERKNFQSTNACAKNALLNLWVLWEIIHPSDLLGSHLIARVRTFSHRITQMNRIHSISQSPCGRQNSQNLTATFSYNVLWILYAGGVLWARNCAQMRSVKSVSSVRDNTPQWFAWVSSHSEGAYFFSQNNTDEQNTQHFTEPLRAAELTEPYSQF